MGQARHGGDANPATSAGTCDLSAKAFAQKEHSVNPCSNAGAYLGKYVLPLEGSRRLNRTSNTFKKLTIRLYRTLSSAIESYIGLVLNGYAI